MTTTALGTPRVLVGEAEKAHNHPANQPGCTD
jgi:hypothetical protein